MLVTNLGEPMETTETKLELLQEAIALYSNLYEMMWQEATQRKTERYFRLERISNKALSRWSRREKKWEESLTFTQS